MQKIEDKQTCDNPKRKLEGLTGLKYWGKPETSKVKTQCPHGIYGSQTAFDGQRSMAYNFEIHL